MAHNKIYKAEKTDYNYSELQIYLNANDDLFVILSDNDGYDRFIVLPLADAKDIVADLTEAIKKIEERQKSDKS